MKTNKWTLIFLLFTGIILFAAQSAIGGCEIPFLDEFVVDKKAPGTKDKGTLALYFEEDLNNLFVFARIEKKRVLHAFADKIENIEFTEFLNDPTAVSEFFTDNVIPYLYNCDPGFDDAEGCNTTVYPNCAPCPPVALKAYSEDVNWDNPGSFDNNVYLSDPYKFYILDFVIAVDD